MDPVLHAETGTGLWSDLVRLQFRTIYINCIILILHGGQDRQQKQSTGTHMIELGGG